MTFTYPAIAILDNPTYNEKLTIIDGPDGVGKSTLIREIERVFKERGQEIRVIRFPGNREKIQFRDIILSDTVRDNPKVQPLLFVADFIYTFDTEIKPFLEDPNIFFLFDRFIPSTCVYQKLPVEFFNTTIETIHPEMANAFAFAHYYYLIPLDMEKHLERLSTRGNEDVNHFDPQSLEAIDMQITDYTLLAVDQALKGRKFLGSLNATIVNV